MKKSKKLLSLTLVSALAIMTTACGSSSYDEYSKAYSALVASGCLDADYTLDISTDSNNIQALGNMKVDLNSQAMYFELSIDDNKVVQYLSDGKVYTEVNGEKMVTDTNNKEQAEKNPDNEGAAKKENADSFDENEFINEMATALEATKIKEMGLLNPIPESVVTKVTSADDGNGTTYTFSLSEVMVSKLFETLIAEQTSDSDTSLSFEDMKDFSCVMHANSDGVLDNMKYGGSTVVTVPAELTGSEEMTFDMDITINVDLNNPGEAVEVPSYDISDF